MILRFNEILFSNTSMVEKDELYIIDYEGFQREILKIQPKNNDDLNVVTKGSQMSNRAKSSSPSQKKKKSKSKKNQNQEAKDNPGSETFVKSQKQAQFIELILKEEEKNNLTESEKIIKNELALEYMKFHSRFPTSCVHYSRENMQRIVVKLLEL